ncbi:MAG: tetratricopeptide repeat protein [Ktedonobacteraceae bacterium]
MTKKKNTHISASLEENAQAQHLFEHTQQLITTIRASQDRQQVEAALAEINNSTEGVQMALLSLLDKEHTLDTADLLAALYEFATFKEVRKEARRTLIRFEGVKIYPHWEAPPERVPALGALHISINPPRFWKGFVSDTRAMGEVQMLLCWQQGEDYKEVRVLGFLLEFWHDGVKDVFVNLESKRSFENFLNQILTHMPDVKLKDCSLAHGHRLLLEALAVNTKSGVKPSREYQLHHSLLKQLILDVPGLDEEEELDEDEESDDLEIELSDLSDLSGLEPTAIVGNFVEYWVDGNYAIAYDLLTQDSPLREGLSKEEWVERRDTWDETFTTDDFEPVMLQERDAPKSKLWLPNPFSNNPTTTTREVEAAWSFEVEKMPLDQKLPELPAATIIYKETGRHWFWASYTLVQEDGEWRIQTMTDEFAKAQNLPLQELRKLMEGCDDKAKQIAQKHSADALENATVPALAEYLSDIVACYLQMVYYADVLIKKAPLEREIYAEAADLMRTLGLYERCLAYLELLIEKFPEDHAKLYRRIGDVQLLQSKRCEEIDEDDDGADFYEELGEESLLASLDLENHFDTHIALANLFINQEERLDEAEEQLQQARPLITEPDHEAEVEYWLAEIATKREQFPQALKHYQRVAEIDAEDSTAWSDLGNAHLKVNNFEEAEACYKQAIALDPADIEYYSLLGLLYREQGQPAKAIQALEEGLLANPDSVGLYMYLAGAHVSNGDYQQAEFFLKKAEHLSPEDEVIQEFRESFMLRKALHEEPATHLPKKLSGPKRKGGR